MTDDMPDSLIPYDDIVQEALRAVVGRVLSGIQSNLDLPGGHHFYITFKTQAPGVAIPDHLRQRFPDAMTVVLQNKFWDLVVDDQGFEVGLTFSQVPTKLSIPFAAITAFADPSVKFGLQFMHQTGAVDETGEVPALPAPTTTETLDSEPPAAGANVVALDKFRRR